MSNVQGPKSKVIGLTGPIAAGKDQAAKILARRGAFIIDADQAAHRLYEQIQSPLWQELVKHFGSKILLRGGKINRKKLGEIVFSNKKELQALNAIVHPYLKEEVIRILESRQRTAESGTQELIVINAAVLAEIGLLESVDEVWAVLASKEVRLKRLIKAGLSKEAANKRINAQASQKDYLAIADLVIENNGTIKQLHAKISANL